MAAMMMLMMMMMTLSLNGSCLPTIADASLKLRILLLAHQ